MSPSSSTQPMPIPGVSASTGHDTLSSPSSQHQPYTGGLPISPGDSISSAESHASRRRYSAAMWEHISAQWERVRGDLERQSKSRTHNHHKKSPSGSPEAAGAGRHGRH